MKKLPNFIPGLLLIFLICGVSVCSASTPDQINLSNKSNSNRYVVDINNPMIKSTDSEEIKQKKMKKTEILNRMEKLGGDLTKKEDNKIATAEDYMKYKEQSLDLSKQITALGLDPTEGMDKGQFFDKQIDLYIDDCIIRMHSYCDENGNVIDKGDNQDHYNAIVNGKAYLEGLKKDYESGKISGDEAFDALNTYSSGSLIKIFTKQY